MKTLQDILVEAQQLVVDLQSLIDAPVVTPVTPEIKDVVVENTDGTSETLVPETPTDSQPETSVTTE